MTWDELPCADWYNSYRLTAKTLEDADGDGMADNYGSCLQADIPFPVAADPTDPPDGFTNFYLITGENDQGEGSLGFNSVPQTRSNQSPCP